MQVLSRTARPTRRVFLSTACASAALAQPPRLQYQSRGEYCEGIRTKLATGEAGIALIAALIGDPEPPGTTLPARFQALFYRPAQDPVYLTIREVAPLYYYWLEPEARTRGSWKPGQPALFSWQTQTVIRELNYRNKTQLNLDMLGALARLHAPAAGKDDPLDEVLPVALYHAQRPTIAQSYRFGFRPEERSNLEFKFYEPGQSAPSQTQPFPVVLGSQPHYVTYNPSTSADGWRRLVVSGYAIRNNKKVYKEVRFYHRCDLTR